MGVAPVSDCASALDPGLQAALAAFGCTQVLRATYVDATQTRAATVAIVVLSVDPDSPAKRTLDVQNENKGRFDSQKAMAVRVPVFPGTAAAGFTNTARVAWHLSVSLALPYEVVTAAGFTDGRTGNFGPGSKDGTDSGIQSLARTVGDRIENGLWQLAMEIP
jgi:hypothetical protein